MDLAPVRPRSPRRPVLRDRRLVALLAEFCRLQLHARVVTDSIAGDDDIRLQVWRDPGDVIVELLWCGPQDPPPATPTAVRVQGRYRQVWGSPGDGCTSTELVRFVSDLLRCDHVTLRRRYQLLG